MATKLELAIAGQVRFLRNAPRTAADKARFLALNDAIVAAEPVDPVYSCATAIFCLLPRTKDSSDAAIDLRCQTAVSYARLFFPARAEWLGGAHLVTKSERLALLKMRSRPNEYLTYDAFEEVGPFSISRQTLTRVRPSLIECGLAVSGPGGDGLGLTLIGREMADSLSLSKLERSLFSVPGAH